MEFIRLIEQLIGSFTGPLIEVLNRPSLVWSMLAALAALGVALNLTAIAFWSYAKRGLRYAWPLLLSTLSYGVMFVKVPPSPIVTFVSRDTDQAWNAIRIILLGVSIYFTYWELMRTQRDNDRLQAQNAALLEKVAAMDRRKVEL